MSRQQFSSTFKIVFFLLTVIFSFSIVTDLDAAPQKSGSKKVQKLDIRKIPKNHPRLFITAQTAGVIKRNAKTFYGKPLAERIISDADNILKMKPLERKITYQLLFVSRGVAAIIQHLGVAYYLTGDKKYAERAIREMENAAGFVDWNPSHFLDTAEMTFALAVGYDWFYRQMTPAQRKKIATAIIEKGLKPSIDSKSHWLTQVSNWNPVCHGGMIAGAIAVADLEPELAETIIARALKLLPPYVRKCYYPNGAFPEGPGYWSYGTLYLSYIIAMLDTVFKTDFGLADSQGLEATCEYAGAMTGPSGVWFNHSDCGSRRQLSFQLTFFAHYFNRPELLDKVERKMILEYAGKRPDKFRRPHVNQHIPMVMPYLKFPEEKNLEGPLFYFSTNTPETPVAIVRSDHSDNAAWLAIKGGRPASLHGHMDVGSFCFESKGKRWVFDLGSDHYGTLQKKGIQIWNSNPVSTRWSVFRYGIMSHNIFHLNERRQNVYEISRFLKAEKDEIVLDLKPTYQPLVTKATRTVALLPDGGMRCTDSLAGLKPGTKVRWQICTFTIYGKNKDGSLTLTYSKDNQMLLKNSANAEWRVLADDQVRNKDFDSPNPGLKMVSFGLVAPEDGKIEYTVTLTPVKQQQNP